MKEYLMNIFTNIRILKEYREYGGSENIKNTRIIVAANGRLASVWTFIGLKTAASTQKNL